MLIKIIGNVFVLVSSATVGLYFSFKEGFRIEALLQIKKALGILRSEIEYSGSPLSEAFLNISNRVDKPFSDIFKDISGELSKWDNPGVCEVWKRTFHKYRGNAYLAAEDFESIYSFGKTLGYLDKSMQLNSISMLEDYIDDTTERLNAVSEKNKKMYSSLGILLGILICVVLL